MNRQLLQRFILYGVALGDISGSRYEGVPYPGQQISEIQSIRAQNLDKAYPDYDGYKTIELFTEFHHLTDDTVLTFAIYKATQKIKDENIVDENEIVNVYTEYLRRYHNKYPNAGYASGFDDWAYSETTDRNYSYGNGSAMRVGGIAVLCDDIDDIIKYAYYSALPSHSHREGIKGAICTSVIYWILSYGGTRADVLEYLQQHYPKDNGREINSASTLSQFVAMNRVNPWSTLSVICQTSIVEAVVNFLESDSFESCLRNSYRYLCDRDTISAIAGPMAAIYYKDLTISDIDGEKLIQKYLDKGLFDDIS